MIRRLVPQLLVPLAIVASLLAADPWLRAFPVSVGAVPLLGAAALSVLIPAVTLRLGARLWMGAIIDLVALVLYLLFVVVHDPTGFDEIITGLHRGPSQILTFALPLVTPRNLMVGPAVLIWVAGALAGECFARRWATLLPYVGLLVSFGLAYAGTQRAVGGTLSSIRLRETLLAGGLLVTLLLVRTAQSWVRQDESAESTQADGVLPLRGFGIGVATAVVVAVVASVAVQSNAFPKKAATPQRRPVIDASNPLAPLQFVASLRPATASASAPRLFTVRIDQPAPGYFGIANLDFYDGAGWSFDRTFRPSGGVLPGDSDSSLDTGLTKVSQQYTIGAGGLTTAPWIPMLYRAERVTGTTVDIDPASGMIVPAGALTEGTTYTVDSKIAPITFSDLDAQHSTPDTSTPANDVQVPPTLRTTLDKLISTFAEETGTPTQPALPFLKALQLSLEKNYSLSGSAQGSALGSRSPTATPTPSTSPPASKKPSTTPAKKAPKSGAQRSGDATSVRPLAAPSEQIASTRAGTKKTPAKSPAKKTPAKTPAKPPAKTPAKTPAPSTPVGSTSSGASSDLAGGTSFADVIASVLGQTRAGTPEQFATLIALIARELGVPARVVTGFRVLHEGSPKLPADVYQVNGTEAWTWAEIPIVGKGWLALDATPAQFSDQSRQPDAGASLSPTPTNTPTQALLTPSSNGGHAVAGKATPPVAKSEKPQHGLVVALLLALAALVLALLLILLSRKRLRRARRRRAPDLRTQLLGAWQESLDMLTESGLPELTTLTSAEIADLTGEQFGSAPRDQTALLGRAANSVAYSAVTVVERSQVDEAWAAQRTLRRAVRKQLAPGARIAAAVRYHRSRRALAGAGPESWAAEAAARADESMHGRARRGVPRRYQGRRRR